MRQIKWNKAVGQVFARSTPWELFGMHRISGWIIRPFLYPVSGRIPDMATGYPVIEKAGYPAGYQAKYAAKEKHLNTAYNILQLFDFM